jgi:hypothetical protein
VTKNLAAFSQYPRGGKDTGPLMGYAVNSDRYPHYHPGGATPFSAARFGDWRIVEFFETGKVELYNLKDDVGETTDLSAMEPGRAAKFHTKLKTWRQEVGAQLATPNPDYDLEKDRNPSKKKKN